MRRGEEVATQSNSKGVNDESETGASLLAFMNSWNWPTMAPFHSRVPHGGKLLGMESKLN